MPSLGMLGWQTFEVLLMGVLGSSNFLEGSMIRKLIESKGSLGVCKGGRRGFEEEDRLVWKGGKNEAYPIKTLYHGLE